MGSNGPQYVYAVVPSGADRAVGEPEGIGRVAVTAVKVGTIAALVSDAPEGRIRPTRANLKSHEEVVSKAHEVAPVLPVRFGTVMPDSRAVREELLAPNSSRFAQALEELAGKDEFRLRASYLPGVALEEVLERSPAVKRLRDLGAGTERAAMRDRIQLGELVFAELQGLRDFDANEILHSLAPHMAAWVTLNDSSEDVAVYAACLVERSSREKWDAALSSLAERESLRLAFEVVGPLPAWDFNHARLEVG